MGNELNFNTVRYIRLFILLLRIASKLVREGFGSVDLLNIQKVRFQSG